MRRTGPMRTQAEHHRDSVTASHGHRCGGGSLLPRRHALWGSPRSCDLEAPPYGSQGSRPPMRRLGGEFDSVTGSEVRPMMRKCPTFPVSVSVR